MNVLVTGGAGYIGSHMVHVLKDKNINVTIIDNLTTGNPNILPANTNILNYNVGNIEAVTQLMKKEKFDAVIHFAASVVVPESVKNPIKYYLNNTKETINFIKACAEAQIGKFIFSSTAAVYGNPETNIVSEDTKTNPESPYGMSKLMSEKIIQDTFKVYDIPYAILRYFNVAGADPNGRTGQINLPASHLIRVACQTATYKREFVPVYGDDYNTPDGTCIRDYIHIMDLIDAHIRAIDYLNSGASSIFNCGYGHGFSVLEVIDAVKKVSGNDFQVKIEKRRLGDPESLISNNLKIKRELNWIPRFDNIIKIVSDAYKWELKLKNI